VAATKPKHDPRKSHEIDQKTFRVPSLIDLFTNATLKKKKLGIFYTKKF